MGTGIRAGIFATLLLLVFSGSPDLNAQGRGGGVRGGMMPGRAAPTSTFSGRPGTQFAGRPVAPFVTSPVGPAVPSRVIAPHANVPHNIGGAHRTFNGSFNGRHNVIVSQPFFGGFGGFAPYYWPDPFLYSTPSYVEPQYVPPPESASDSELSYQVQRLSQEIEDLRAQQDAIAASRMQPPPPPPPATPEPPPVPTTLVFRDGRHMSIQNYAIVGNMLWVLDQKNPTKIPITDLDLDATQKTNRSNGVRFSLGR